MALTSTRAPTVIGTILVASLAVTGGRLQAQLAEQASAPATEPGQPTFTRDVAPIFFRHCTTCHRPGQIAPMSLLTYQEARPWARAILNKVLTGEMPPWHADP